MAKNDNLKDFLTDVADAIREKKGKSGKINPQDFSSEIKSIETGGGAVESKEYKDVNFFDYEGTILYSYTWDEAKVMTELPPLPDRTSEGLVCQGWNYTLEEMKAQADENGEHGYADIGAMYITNDGKTRVYISIGEELPLDFKLHLRGTAKVSIDWGDGFNEEIEFTTFLVQSHSYEIIGNYCIAIEVISGECYIGAGNIASGLAGDSKAYDNTDKVKLVHIGQNIGLHNYSFAYMTYLEAISMPMSLMVTLLERLVESSGIRHLNIPRSASGMATRTVNGCWRIETISIPPTGVIISSQFCQSSGLRMLCLPTASRIAVAQAFHSATRIQSIKYVEEISALPDYIFYNCQRLRHIPNYPDSITIIGTAALSNCLRIKKFTIPMSVKEVRAQAFYNDVSMTIIDFSKCSQVPTLVNSSAFYNIPTDCKIVVPDVLVDEWKAATNWTTYADYIIGKTEYLNSGGEL